MQVTFYAKRSGEVELDKWIKTAKAEIFTVWGDFYSVFAFTGLLTMQIPVTKSDGVTLEAQLQLRVKF